MNFLKRATTSILRQPVKFIILLLIIFILSAITSGAISAVTAITNTEANLRHQMRPIVAFEADGDAIYAAWLEAGGYWYEWQDGNSSGREMRGQEYWPTVLPITSEMVRQIAVLPQVASYHYSITSWFQTQLIEYLPDGAESTTGGSMCVWDEENSDCFEHLTLDNINQKTLHGTSDYEPFEMREGLIELVAGSNLENHQSTIVYPALVSTGFAEVNGFSIGTIFTLESQISRMTPLDVNITSWEEFFFDTMEHEFEIVGLFDVVPLETDDDWFEAQRQRELANRIFTVNAATVAIELFEFEGHMAAAEVAGEDAWFDPDDWNIWLQTSILLTDPLELESFTEAVASYLPEFWMVTDLTGSFEQISASMESLNTIADGILLATVGATILILSLLITLFLKDRRHEIGIYLALGEKRSKIILQTLIEVLTTAFIGITFSILVGNIIAANISDSMIRTELAQPVEQDLWRDPSIHGWIDLGLGGNLTPEEMLDAFDTSLTANAIVLIYVAGLGTAVVSTLIPIIYVVKLEPKKVLL